MPGEVSMPREGTGAITGALFPESRVVGTLGLALGISVNTGRRLGHDSAQEREIRGADKSAGRWPEMPGSQGLGVLDALNDSAFGRVSARRGQRQYYSRVLHSTLPTSRLQAMPAVGCWQCTAIGIMH